MLTTKEEIWLSFLDFMKKRISSAEYQNWFKPIQLLEDRDDLLTLQVPNIFVQQYLIDNYKEDLISFLPLDNNGDLNVNFV